MRRTQAEIGGARGVASPATLAGLAGCLLVLLAHVRLYWFLTDDAFISFRYARNFADGFGLVFNPGFERVEGYTNFLWVVILAALQRCTGWAPHLTANWLSATAGVGVWLLVVVCCWRRNAGSPQWLVLFPALWLAMNRSVAVWSTGGLETMLFELLIVAAALQAIRDLERRSPSWYRLAVLLALATLTRPDGALIAAAVFGARGLAAWWEQTLDWRRAAAGLAIFALLIGAHLAFRRVYYAEWLPNTYYAKLGGESWWDMGGIYFEAFLLEYAAWVWMPVVLVGVVSAAWTGRGAAAWVVTAVVVPHAFYVAYCGGDHFEYRPIAVYFPLLAILLADGLAAIASRWRRPVTAVVWGLACCASIAVIPVLTHWDFPTIYQPGFPGLDARANGSRGLVRLDWHPIVARVPGLRWYVGGYNRDIQTLSAHYVALRQEEHRMFLATVEPEGHRLRQLVADGLLPRDTYIGIPCVGAIPYFSNLRTFDVHGLTDKHVARQEMEPKESRMMAHAKIASYEYMEQCHVDLIALDVHLLVKDPAELADSRDYARQMGTLVPVYVSSQPVVDGYFLLAVIRKPPATVQARFPAVQLQPAWE